MYGEDVTGTDPHEFWDPRMRASIEMTEHLATEIHEEVQELRKAIKEMAAGLEKSVKKLSDKATKSGE
jgi:hypothetical protein